VREEQGACEVERDGLDSGHGGRGDLREAQRSTRPIMSLLDAGRERVINKLCTARDPPGAAYGRP